jgi:hypothetical protein
MTTTITATKWVGVMAIVMLFTIVAIPVYSQLTTEQEQVKRILEQDLEKMKLESQERLQQEEEKEKQEFLTLEPLEKILEEAMKLFKPKNEIVKEKLEQSRLIYNQTGSLIKAIKAFPTESEIKDAGLKVCESFGPDLISPSGCIPTTEGFNNYMLEVFEKGIREAPNGLAEMMMKAIKERWMTEMSK